MSEPLVLEVVVKMGGSTGTYRFTDYQQIVEIGMKLEDLLGEPSEIEEEPDARSAMGMAMELAFGNPDPYKGSPRG